MPLVRSKENLTLAEDYAVGDSHPATVREGPLTRQQSRRDVNIEPTSSIQSSMDDGRVRQIVTDSLSEFRNEILCMLSNEFRNILDSSNFQPTSNVTNIRQDSMPCNPADAHNEIEVPSEKILNVIRNWRLHFTGNSTDISADEFIYRVNTLTTTNLKGNFEVLCKHAHLLFEGKALQWYWRFHRNCDDLNWFRLTDALKRQYKDFHTDFDVIDDIRRRKQKKSETFDEFLDAIMILCDKLRTPLSDQELCETILRNLNPEIRHELLHLEITHVSQLRKAVRRHEKFVNDMASTNNIKRFGQKPQILELDCESNTKTVPLDSEDTDTEICVIKKSGKCWNCEKFGHNYMDCLEPRKIFCYGCGLKETYRPQCSNCSGKRENLLKDVRSSKNGHPRN